ncbi:MAG: CPBP family intramembrane glutamic endopeptidase, partial [Bacteroidota bacterium]
PSALGVDRGFSRGLGWAFLFTLPMLVGYAFIGEWNATLTFKKIYWGVILAALAEELFFRGYLFGQLFRFGGWGFVPAGLLSALIFGSVHLYQANDLGSAIGIFAVTGMGGMWFAWLYMEWNKNLWLPIFLHFFMNGYWALFSIADNAAGGFYANVFRAMTIVATILVTAYFHKKKGNKTITKSNLWKNSESEFTEVPQIYNNTFSKVQ